MNKIVPYIKLIERTLPFSPLLTVQINLTTNCGGLHCLTCKRSTWPRKELTAFTVEKLFKDLNMMEVETAYITGGDPLLYPYLFNILEKWRGNVRIGMVTTAAFNVYSPDFWKSIYKNVEWCRITLDTLDADIYKKIKGKDLFNNVIENCDIISKIFKTKEEKFKKVRINTLQINGVNDNEMFFIPNKVKEWGFDFRLHQVHTFGRLRSNQEDIAPTLCPTTQVHCMIDADGLVFPCSDIARENDYYKNRNLYHAYGNLNYNSISELWNKNSHKRRILYESRCEECKWCSPRANESNRVYTEFLKIDRGLFL